MSVTVTLTWKAGADAQTHYMNLGTVPGKLDPKGFQSATQWTPSGLQPETDYYWRIDESNSLGKTLGTEWHFKTGAPVIPGQASSPTPSHGEPGVSLRPTLAWFGGIPSPATHEVYFGKSPTPGSAEFKTSLPVGTRTFQVGPLDANATYYWRIDEKSAAGTTTGPVWRFETGSMPGQATSPSPGNGDTGVSDTPTLTWVAGSGTADHLIYFGGSEATMTYKATQAVAKASFSPGTLVPGTYYWRIDERNSSGTTTGTVWSFTTNLPPVAAVQARIARCSPAAKPDETGGGVGHSPDRRKVEVHFGYATGAKADDGRKGDAAAATKKIELCIVDSTGAPKCDASTNANWLVYESNSKPKLAPTADNVLNNDATVLPAGIKPFTFELPGIDYADAANKGKFVILRVNGQSTDDARKFGGTCPLPYLLNSSAHFEAYGTEDTVTDPWAGKGFGSACTGGGLYLNSNQCISKTSASPTVQNLLVDFEGTVDAHTGRFGAKDNQRAWSNGTNTGVCGGDCKGHIWIYPGLRDWAGWNSGAGQVAVDPGSMKALSNWYANGPLSVITHEMFHALQGTYMPDYLSVHRGFIEGNAASMDRNLCIENLSQLSGRCVSAGNLGSGPGAMSDALLHPGDNMLSWKYESSIYWRYFMEQYALPLTTGGFARPPGGQKALIESNPRVNLGDSSRGSDEGSDILGLLYQQIADAGGAKAPALQLADQLFVSTLQRNLDNLLLDFHTAILLKDYKGVPLEWRFEWVGDFNAGAASSPVPGRAKPALPINDLKPFQLKNSTRHDELNRVFRIVDRVNVGPSDTVANGTEEVINAYGAAFVSVLPTTENSVVTVRLRPAHHAPPRFRVFTVDSAGVPTLVPQCTKEEGRTPAGRMRMCDPSGNVTVDVATGSGSSAVKEILVVASASAQPASFFYEIGAGSPIVDIRAPNPGQKALAGTPNPGGSVRPFLVEFVVRDGTGRVVPGLTATQLRLSSVLGGTTTTISDVRLLPLSGGVYFARATLPTSVLPSVSADLDLKVEYLDQTGSTVLASSTKEKVLEITGTPPKVVTELLIDISDSMNEDGKKKLNAVKDAAKFLLDTIPDGDEVGIITYNHDANNLEPIEVLNDSRRKALQNTIKGLIAGGCTSLGDPLLEASSIFKTRYTSGSPWLNIMMLSDGINTAHYTPAYYYTDKANDLPAQHDGDGTTTCGLPDPNPGDTNNWAAGSLNWWNQTYKPRVTTIAFGQDADLTELANIATSTKGLFIYADEGGIGQVGKATHELADAYRRGYTLAAQGSRIGAARVATTNDLPGFTVEQHAQDLQVSLLSRLSAPSTYLYLVDPDGTMHPASYHDDKTAVYRVAAPKAGPWHWYTDPGPIITLQQAVTVTDAPPVFVEAVVTSPLVLLAVADVEHAATGLAETDDQRWVGKDVFIRAVPTDGGDLLNVSVNATVIDPLGGSANVVLLDDGAHADGVANDGVYGAVLQTPSLAGAYSVKILASGNTPNVGDFQRETTVGFSLHKAPDEDGDTVPDYCDPQSTVPDADEDPDRDGLTNAQECSIGTDPKNPDTDRGGKIDGPEVASGRDPRDPSDDPVRPFSIHVSPCHAKVLISPEIVPTDSVEIEVSSSGPIGPYSLVYTGAAAPSFKLDAPTGDERCYRMRTLGSLQTAWSPPFCIRTSTTQSDPHPPTLRASLVDGTTWARSRKVQLDVFATDGQMMSDHTPRCDEVIESGVTDMQVSFNPDFIGVAWQPYNRIVDLDLPATGDEFDIWVRVRDGAGNLSESLLVHIRVMSPSHQTSDFVIFGLGGTRLEDGVSLVGGDLANRGTTLTEIGATAISGNVVSNGDVYLRSGGRIEGYVETAKTFTMQTGAIVTGTITENATVVLPDLPAFTIQPGTGGGVNLGPDQALPLAPGDYGDLTLGARSKLTLESGTYRFGSVQTEPDSQLILNKTSGPIYIHMRSLTHRGKVIDAAGDNHGKTLFAVAGSDLVTIEGPFVGTLLAPNADATIGTGVALEHQGAFLARTVLVRSKATLYHLPWSYAQ